MTAEFPEALQFLFEPARIKVAYGGRGSAKSWSFARALLLLGARRQLRILCARETQKSIADSVHQLLRDQISGLALDSFYRVEKAHIYGANGTQFSFAGLKHNPAEIKSYEGCDIVWVEEAQSVSKASWDLLIPTIRREGSEIWVSFNPDLETDETYQRFVKQTPPGAVVVKVNYPDNPWFGEPLLSEMQHCRDTRPDEYRHIWLGFCQNTLAGAIYAVELHQAELQNRIRTVPYDPLLPVHCFWDLGYGDLCAIWLAQAGAFEYRIIDYIENSRQKLGWYLEELQNRHYVYGEDFLPWDIGAHAKLMGSGKSIEELMRAAGRRVRLVPKLSVTDGINAARTLFPLCYFDADRCADGLSALRHYRYGEVKTLGHPTREPLHDWASHAADAFRYLAICLSPEPPPERAERPYGAEWERPSADGWMR